MSSIKTISHLHKIRFIIIFIKKVKNCWRKKKKKHKKNKKEGGNESDHPIIIVGNEAENVVVGQVYTIDSAKNLSPLRANTIAAKNGTTKRFSLLKPRKLVTSPNLAPLLLQPVNRNHRRGA
ncbi:hypothetical protein Ddye_001773 [Dipteronia dyeriana]|uniref:Uncharacterized protein n=1 Tax=Dipteronia dyeriana TaxID=168575 RepID=A0AAD9XP97_9ROSI|nr:hypothetical protein Ddye_001773 [Dipteronia dyeriana]